MSFPFSLICWSACLFISVGNTDFVHCTITCYVCAQLTLDLFAESPLRCCCSFTKVLWILSCIFCACCQVLRDRKEGDLSWRAKTQVVRWPGSWRQTRSLPAGEEYPKERKRTCAGVCTRLEEAELSVLVWQINLGLSYRQSIFQTTAETAKGDTQYLTWTQGSTCWEL